MGQNIFLVLTLFVLTINSAFGIKCFVCTGNNKDCEKVPKGKPIDCNYAPGDMSEFLKLRMGLTEDKPSGIKGRSASEPAPLKTISFKANDLMIHTKLFNRVIERNGVKKNRVVRTKPYDICRLIISKPTETFFPIPSENKTCPGNKDAVEGDDVNYCVKGGSDDKKLETSTTRLCGWKHSMYEGTKKVNEGDSLSVGSYIEDMKCKEVKINKGHVRYCMCSKDGCNKAGASQLTVSLLTLIMAAVVGYVSTGKQY